MSDGRSGVDRIARAVPGTGLNGTCHQSSLEAVPPAIVPDYMHDSGLLESELDVADCVVK